MRTITRLASLLLIALPLGCSATSLDSSWRNPAYAGGTFRKIMVMVASQDASLRRQTEDAFVAQFASRGVQGIPSYTLLPQDTPPSNDQLTQVVHQSGADAVLAARLIDRTQETSNFSGGAPNMYPSSYTSYYSSGLSPSVSSSSYTYDVFTIETKFYQVSPENLIWTGTTRTSDPTDRQRELNNFTRIISEALTKQNLIPPVAAK